MLCRATQDRRLLVKGSDKTRSTGGGIIGQSPQYSCPMDYMKRQKKYDTGRLAQVGRCLVGYSEIPAELFKTLKDDAVKVLHAVCQQIWKTQQWPQY